MTDSLQARTKVIALHVVSVLWLVSGLAAPAVASTFPGADWRSEYLMMLRLGLTPVTLAADVPTVTVSEGAVATNSGTFAHAEGDVKITLSASVGSIIQDDAAGTWFWSYTPADGPEGATTVTITAKDDRPDPLIVHTTFTLTVNNVAPRIPVTADDTVDNGMPYHLNLGGVFDPGADTVSGFSIDWGDGEPERFVGSPVGTTQTHTYSGASAGTKSIVVWLTDEDGTFAASTNMLTIFNARPVAGVDALSRPGNATVVEVLISALLANDADADGDPLTLWAVGNALPAGATVALEGGRVIYSAPATNAGQGGFNYTLTDGPGGHSVSGSVIITETGNVQATAVSVTQLGGSFTMKFLGVPGQQYRIQYALATAFPPVWLDFSASAIHTAGENGVFLHTDANPPDSVRLYRAVAE